MKKILLLLLIFFNILPFIDEGEIKFTNITATYAQEYGEEEPPECPENPPMTFKEGNYCITIYSTGSEGDEDCPYTELRKEFTPCNNCIDCNSGGEGGEDPEPEPDQPYEFTYTTYINCEICTITVMRHTNGDPDEELSRYCNPDLSCGGGGGGPGPGGTPDFPYTVTTTEYQGCYICVVSILRHTNGDPDEELNRDCNYDDDLCGGTGGDTYDCAGVLGGSAYYDQCGSCVGGNTGVSPCTQGSSDCAGVANGLAYIDQCGTCVGGSTGQQPCTTGYFDCAGVENGGAYLDQCGQCVGGSTGNVNCAGGNVDCAGVVNGTAYIDRCGGCVTTTFEDCDNVIGIGVDDQQIFEDLRQEDLAVDALLGTACQGTMRTGNHIWPGTKEHWIIMIDYVSRNPAGGEVEYNIPGSGSTGGTGYADMVNTLTGEIFEIKPDHATGITNGQTEVANYVTHANLSCPPGANGTTFTAWRPGTDYTTRILPGITRGTVLQARLAANGVVVYKTQSAITVPVPVTIPQSALDKLKNLIRKLKKFSSYDPEMVIANYMRDNPELVAVLKGAAYTAAVALIVGTIAEDIATLGGGIADDWASFTLAYRIVRFAWKLQY